MIWSVVFALLASALLISPVVVLHRMPFFQTIACVLFGIIVVIFGATRNSARGRVASIVTYGVGVVVLPIAGRGLGLAAIAGAVAGGAVVVVNLLGQDGRDDE